MSFYPGCMRVVLLLCALCSVGARMAPSIRFKENLLPVPRDDATVMNNAQFFEVSTSSFTIVVSTYSQLLSVMVRCR